MRIVAVASGGVALVHFVDLLRLLFRLLLRCRSSRRTHQSRRRTSQIELGRERERQGEESVLGILRGDEHASTVPHPSVVELNTHSIDPSKRG